MRLKIIIISIIIVIILLFLVFSSRVGEPEVERGQLLNLISARAGSIYIVNFSRIRQTGYTYAEQGGGRGKYFTYLEKMIGIEFEEDCEICLVVEFDRPPTMFGVDGNLNNPDKNCYYVMFGNLSEDKLLKNYRSFNIGEIAKTVFMDKVVYEIPSSEAEGSKFYITFITGNQFVMASNLESLEEILNLYYENVSSISLEEPLIKYFKELRTDISSYGIFEFNGARFPESVKTFFPGIKDLEYIAISNMVDNRVGLMKLNFLFSSVNSLTEFADKITVFRKDLIKRFKNSRERDLLIQFRIQKNSNNLELSFYMTHSQMLIIEKLLKEVLAEVFVND